MDKDVKGLIDLIKNIYDNKIVGSMCYCFIIDLIYNCNMYSPSYMKNCNYCNKKEICTTMEVGYKESLI